MRVPTTLNPMGMERGKWQGWGIQPSFATPQLSVIDAFAAMGVTPTMSCTPYLFPELHAAAGRCAGLGRVERGGVRQLGHRRAQQPRRRAERDRGGHRGPHRALRLSPGREPARELGRRSAGPLKSVADFGALSYTVGKAVGNGVPWFADLAESLPPLPADLTLGGPAGDRLKTLGAGLAAYGAVARLSHRRLHARGA